MQTHIPKICSDFLQNHIDKQMFEIYNKSTVEELLHEALAEIYTPENVVPEKQNADISLLPVCF